MGQRFCHQQPVGIVFKRVSGVAERSHATRHQFHLGPIKDLGQLRQLERRRTANEVSSGQEWMAGEQDMCGWWRILSLSLQRGR